MGGATDDHCADLTPQTEAQCRKKNEASNEKGIQKGQIKHKSSSLCKGSIAFGHVMRREPDNTSRTALHWTPEGKWKKRRPKNTWRRAVERERKTLHRTSKNVQKLAQNRQKWRTFVAALHARWHNGHECVSDKFLN